MKEPNSRTVAGSRIYAKAPDAPPTNDALARLRAAEAANLTDALREKDALAAKLAEAERELFLMRRVAEGNEAEIARLTRELDERQTEHERLAKMLHSEQIANAALREVVEAAKVYMSYDRAMGGDMMPCHPLWQKVKDALAALEKQP